MSPEQADTHRNLRGLVEDPNYRKMAVITSIVESMVGARVDQNMDVVIDRLLTAKATLLAPDTEPQTAETQLSEEDQWAAFRTALKVHRSYASSIDDRKKMLSAIQILTHLIGVTDDRAQRRRGLSVSIEELRGLGSASTEFDARILVILDDDLARWQTQLVFGSVLKA